MIKQRLETYKTQTRPVVDYYVKSKRMVHINSERKVEAVFKQICSYIDSLIYFKEVRTPEVIFFSGGVGSGQGTQMNKVCAKYGFKGINCSDLLRKAAENDPVIKANIAAGVLVNSEDVVNLIINEMDDNEAPVYIIKGFPKSQENLDAWNNKMNMMAHVAGFYFFNCS